MKRPTKRKSRKPIGPIKEGALKKQLGIKKGQKVGRKRLEQVKRTGTPLERKRANFALNMNRKKR
jgi:hypothetical protein